jgi:hypothetical protein
VPLVHEVQEVSQAGAELVEVTRTLAFGFKGR